MTDRNSAMHGTSVLKIKYIFGMNCDCLQDFELLDSKIMYYSAGSYLTKYSLEDGSQDYAFNNRMYTNITALCLSPMKNYLAVARKGTKTQIQLLDPQFLRPKKSTMALSEEQHKLMPEFNFMAFSPGETRLAAISNPKDPLISLWDIDSNQQNIKLLATVSFRGYSCMELAFCPTKEDTFSLLGHENFKVLKFYDDTIKIAASGISTRKETPQDYSCHTWISSPNFLGLVVCTKSKFIYVLKDTADLLYVIDDSEASGIQVEPVCILQTRDGFILGGEGLKIQKFKKTDQDTFKVLPALRVNQTTYSNSLISDAKGSCIMSMKMDSDEDRLVCVSDARTVYSTLLKTDLSYIKLDNDQINPNFLLGCDPGHSDKITFMDCCVRKPLIATCSSDKTVKIWDYEKKKLVHSLAFSEEAFAVAFHPSGYHLVLAFTDKIQLINLYLRSKDHQSNFKEYAVKSCKFLKFNHGGNLLAVASGDSSPEIIIYRFYEMSTNPIHRFKGHTGIIRCFEWAPDDLSLYSCAATGMIYKWNVKDGERKEIIPKRIANVNDMCISYDNSVTSNGLSYSILLAVDEAESLREFNGMNNAMRTEPGPVFGCVVKSAEKKMIFAGVRDTVKDGLVYFYRHPLSPKETDISYAHNSLGIRRMLLTPKDRYLVTAGMDGTIIMFEVEDKDARAGASLGVEFKDYCPFILVTQAEVSELNSQKALAIGQINNETSQGAGNLDLTGVSADNAIKSNNEFHKMKSNNEEKLEALRKELRTKEEDRKKQIENEVAAHKSKMKELEVYSTGNLGDKQDMIKILEKQMFSNERMFQEKMAAKEREHAAEMRELDRNFQERLLKEQDERRRIEEDIAETEAKNAKELTQIGSEAKNETIGLEKRYKDDENSFKNKQIKLKNEYQSNEKKQTKNKNKKNQLEEERLEALKRQAQVSEQHNELKRIIGALENKLRDKNVIITNSEKKIYDQKKRTGELEKFKYVLDFKIKELKKDMLPREKEIGILKALTLKEDKELKDLHSVQKALKEMVERLESEETGLVKKIDKQKKELIHKEGYIKRFKTELFNAIQLIQKYPELVEELKKMNRNPRKLNEIDEDIGQEYKSQTKHLELAGNRMKKNLELNDRMHKTIIQDQMDANRGLIVETENKRTATNQNKKSNTKDYQAKIGGLKNAQEDYENEMHGLRKIKEDLQEQIAKLESDLEQLIAVKPQVAKLLEERERQRENLSHDINTHL